MPPASTGGAAAHAPPGSLRAAARAFALCAIGAVCAASTLAALAAPATAANLLIVARQDSPVGPLSRSQAADLFLDRGSPPGGLKPVDRREPEMREMFYRAVADMSAQGLRVYWAKRVFTGRGRPPPTLSAEEAARLLAEDRSAITYVMQDQRPPGSKVLLTIDIGEEK
ncbi:MAG: hypothetical protein KF778_17410 [Rhodocyclaceae bacterium]|nr:hypothetical protein [Rhodocyclaceae bacterium]MBX3670181.1 hypothetical protein [Rhodocyclaceae bacterium]